MKHSEYQQIARDLVPRVEALLARARANLPADDVDTLTDIRNLLDELGRAEPPDGTGSNASADRARYAALVVRLVSLFNDLMGFVD